MRIQERNKGWDRMSVSAGVMESSEVKGKKNVVSIRKKKEKLKRRQGMVCGKERKGEGSKTSEKKS